MALSSNQIEDFNYVYFHPKIDNSIYPYRSLAKNMAFFFVKLARDFFFDLKRLRFLVKFNNTVVFYVTSANDFHPLKVIFDNLPEQKKMMINNPARENSVGIDLPRFIPAFISFFFIPAFLIYFLKSSREKREMINYSRNDVLLTYGNYYFIKWLLARSRPKGFVFANDHTFHARILLMFFNQHKIKSFYVQHASVTEHFPKLDMTHALLEGEDAKRKYILAGSDPAKIELIGMIKFDSFTSRVNKSKSIQVVGYALGLEDPVRLVDETKILANHFPDIHFCLRPHPWYYTYMRKSDLDYFLNNLSETSNVSFSDPRSEHVFDFLSRLDVLVAGDSSIHLEGALLNVLPVYYDNRGRFDDYYGYVQANLAVGVRSLEEIIQLIERHRNDRPYMRSFAKLYVETLDTPDEGKSGTMAANFIRSKLTDKA